MTEARRKIAFVLAASDQGTLIVNRLDYRMVDATRGYGVGYQLLESASFDPEEVGVAMSLLKLRRQYHGDGVFALDCGAGSIQLRYLGGATSRGSDGRRAFLPGGSRRRV